MSFFDSEFVRSEMVEISELQEDIYGNVFKFPSMSKEEKVKHVDSMQRAKAKEVCVPWVVYSNLKKLSFPSLRV